MSGYNVGVSKTFSFTPPYSLTSILRTLLWRTLSKTSVIALVWKAGRKTHICKRLQTTPHFKHGRSLSAHLEIKQGEKVFYQDFRTKRLEKNNLS